MSSALKPAILTVATLGTAVYVVRFWTVYAAGELFHRLGWDWTMFWAQAMLVRSGHGADMYDQFKVDDQLQALAHYYTGPGHFQNASPVAYPPWFAPLVVPFTLPPPPIGFALWLALSVLVALFLAVRLKQVLPSVPFWGACVLIFGAFPVALDLFMGQVALIGALAVGEMYLSFRAGRDFRAGLWLSVLLLKPQYAVLFGLLILWKWRPRAIAGAALGTLAFVGFGLLTTGYLSFLRMNDELSAFTDFRSEDASPLLMVNWRAFVLYATPWIGSNQGFLVVAALSAISIVLLLYLWQTPWNPQDPDFPVRFAAVAIGAVATSYHSHAHGMALAMIPVAAAWARPALSTRTRVAILAAAYLPTLWLMFAWAAQRFAVPSVTDVSLWYPWPDGVPVLLFMSAFALACRDAWRLQQPRRYEDATGTARRPYYHVTNATRSPENVA